MNTDPFGCRGPDPRIEAALEAWRRKEQRIANRWLCVVAVIGCTAWALFLLW